MAQKRSVHDFLEKSALPLFIIVLIPVGIIAYAVWDANAPQPAATTTQTVAAPTEPSVTPASISLDDPASLSTSVPSSQFIPFSFTITNTGNTSGSIPYRVSVKWSTGEEDVVDENVVSLDGGASIDIPEDLKFEIATETAEVSLELTQTGQSAQFALPRGQ